MPGTFPLFDGSVQLKLVAPSCVVCFSLSRPWTSGGMAGFRTQLVRLFRCLTPGAYVMTARVLASDGTLTALEGRLVHAPLYRDGVLDACLMSSLTAVGTGAAPASIELHLQRLGCDREGEEDASSIAPTTGAHSRPDSGDELSSHAQPSSPNSSASLSSVASGSAYYVVPTGRGASRGRGRGRRGARSTRNT